MADEDAHPEADDEPFIIPGNAPKPKPTEAKLENSTNFGTAPCACDCARQAGNRSSNCDGSVSGPGRAGDSYAAGPSVRPG